MESLPSPTAPNGAERRAHSGLRFGVTVSNEPGVDLAQEALHAEALGFDVVTLHGDVMNRPQPTLEAWTSLTWLAAATTTLRFAPNVLVLPNRHPAVLAKMAETLDRLSGGRLVVALGAGAGINYEAFRALGLDPRTPASRVEALEEAIDVMRGLWETSSFTFPGRHFRVTAAELQPRPDRRIPIWLGAFGPRMLSLTGRKADGWLPTMHWLPPDAARAGMQRVRAAARKSGRDADDLTYGYNVAVTVDERARPSASLVAGAAAVVAEQLTGFVRAGFDFLNFMPVGDHWQQRVRLAREVVPLVREWAAPGPPA